GSYEDRFGGIARLVGVPGAERLRGSRVAIIGIGGVGSWTVEALARTGVGHLSLIDLDEVCINNANRQLHALDGTVGRAKVDVMAERTKLIQPTCDVVAHQDFFTAKTADSLLDPGFDVVIDAIDSARSKALLIALCHQRNLPIVVCGGAGGRLDPTQLEVADLNRTRGDGLLRRIRDLLRKEHGLPSNAKWQIPTVFSAEPAKWPNADGEICEKGQATGDAKGPGKGFRLDCSTGYGAATFVTGTMGFMAAAIATEIIVGKPA
ncbi:MAG: tRNA threonylcarbamoyladenosine dehydratase, partial [Myxococcales bacterium]|nr:tRNA threonylcarbamoyladenosine dehydratase [Myxococcales bacterium]